jgi:CheY-like chemotaxis protein
MDMGETEHRVLYVDPNPAMRRLMTNKLAGGQLQVEGVGTLEEMHASATSQQPPDLVLIRPDMYTDDDSQQIEAALVGSTVPVIALTQEGTETSSKQPNIEIYSFPGDKKGVQSLITHIEHVVYGGNHSSKPANS